MIPKYIDDWLTIIEQMNNDNTYKLSWGRAIIECVNFDKYQAKDDEVIIHFENISKFMIKYYWNQLFFFNLKQSPYADKDPVICKYVNILINDWKIKRNSALPVWYDEEKVKANNEKLFNKTITRVTKVLHQNVSWRFKNIANGKLEIYGYENGVDQISIKKENAMLLKGEYGIIISKLLNYKWAQLLEKFNYQPKIISKVKGISDAKIKRNNLTKYKNELLKQYNGKAIDFYTGKELSKDDISVDHVIPWSFMYSDDIWNLVLTSKSHNSSKNNSIPSEEIIQKLNERNKELRDKVSSSYQVELKEAIDNDYLNKFYYQCRM